jgi:FlaA1/EpsC-like NDP-sugar epimerase
MLCLLLSAAISLGLMLWTGHRNSSVVLLLLFTLWVGSPFAGMALMYRRAKRWPAVRQHVTYNQIDIISVGSAFIYGSFVGLKQFAKPAGPFLAVPVASWILMAVWFGLTRYFHGRAAGRQRCST